MPSYLQTEQHNYKTTGALARGCELCLEGKKLVLFVTGVCGNGCSYCPVSDQKNMHDIIYANEWKVQGEQDVLQEGVLMDAKGAGITGGDPLAVLERTCQYIRLLKKKFGDDFHIHLYTPLLRVKGKTLQQLYDAGLDEIRFHPKIDDPADWDRLFLARSFDWSVGVEVPLIVGKKRELKKLLSFLAKNQLVDFVNFNEFEYADNEVFEQAGVHYEPKNALSYGVKGSVELGLDLLEYAATLGLAVHLCTAKSKDAVQLAKRMQRRSKHAARIFDAVDDEGLLTRGAIYDALSIADAGYLEKIAALPAAEKNKAINRLRYLRKKLIAEWDIPTELIVLDADRLRLLTTTAVAEHAAKRLEKTVAIVKEYPTNDCFLVEADLLRKRS